MVNPFVKLKISPVYNSESDFIAVCKLIGNAPFDPQNIGLPKIVVPKDFSYWNEMLAKESGGVCYIIHFFYVCENFHK